MSLAAVVLGCCAMGMAAEADAAWLRDAVPDERGFEGAVTVMDAGMEGEEVAWVTVRVPYRAMSGAAREGLARLYLRRGDYEAGPVPLFAHVHYEKPAPGAADWARDGWAVVTSHFDATHLNDVAVGDANNLTRATLQWARRLPFVDLRRFHIDGGSQGGYMTLAMGAEFFPMTAITPIAPVVNWAYNAAYFIAVQEPARIRETPFPESPLPVLAMVSGLVEDVNDTFPVPSMTELFGKDLAAETWARISPVTTLDRIGCPALIQVSTGDMLVPMEQMTGRFLPDYATVDYPEGYRRAFRGLTEAAGARMTFEEALPQGAVAWHVLPVPEGLAEFTLAATMGQEPLPPGPDPIELPWTDSYQWNVSVFDEGPPLPHSGHLRYNVPYTYRRYCEAHRDRPLPAGGLVAPKLDRLMQRYAGELEGLPRLASGEPANRLNFLPLERLDVVAGLIAFAESGPEHLARLASLYAECPRKPLGPAIDLDELRRLRDELRAELGLAR